MKRVDTDKDCCLVSGNSLACVGVVRVSVVGEEGGTGKRGSEQCLVGGDGLARGGNVHERRENVDDAAPENSTGERGDEPEVAENHG